MQDRSLVYLDDAERRLMATPGRAQMHGFATGINVKADVCAPRLTQLSFLSARPRGRGPQNLSITVNPSVS